MEEIWASWWDGEKGRPADGHVLAAGTPLWVRSEHHRVPVHRYMVVERLPRLLGRLLGGRWADVTVLGAEPGGPAPTSRYRSAEAWPLARHPDGATRTFEVRGVDAEGRDFARSGAVHCAHLVLTHQWLTAEDRAALAPQATVGAGAVAAGELSRTRGATSVYTVAAPVDPPVEVSLASGTGLGVDLMDHLLRVVDDRVRHQAVPGDDLVGQRHGSIAPNNVDQVIDGAGEVHRAVVAPEAPLRVEVEIPARNALRAAYALVVRDVDSGEVTTGDVRFVTAVRGRLVGSDVPPELFTDRERAALRLLADGRGDVAAFGRRVGLDVDRAWAALVGIAREVGVDDVFAAADLVTAVHEDEPVLVT